MASNPQGGSTTSLSSSSCGDISLKRSSSSKRSSSQLPALFWYIEMNEWDKAMERARKHPRDMKTWATIRTKSAYVDHVDQDSKASGTKRLALHHACFKLRTTQGSRRGKSQTDASDEDPFLAACRLILLLIQLYAEAAGMRETRHGCLPLHLAAFASCPSKTQDKPAAPSPAPLPSQAPSRPRKPEYTMADTTPVHRRPPIIQKRSSSCSSTDTSSIGGLSYVMGEERRHGDLEQTLIMETIAAKKKGIERPVRSRRSSSSPHSSPTNKPNRSTFNAADREEMAVQVLNALLDAYPKGIRVDSEGGRLPLHTACAGRASPRVISTLLTAYPAAARHRNKDGFLPLHLCGHWGVSHPDVAVTLLKAYPDATLGRNRWERTPLEEALCMAGENGRTHQGALVRYLRKHPTYWSKDLHHLLTNPSPRTRKTKSTLVDVDDTIADSDSSDSFQQRRLDSNKISESSGVPQPPKSHGLIGRLTPRNVLRKSPSNAVGGSNTGAECTPATAERNELMTCIKTGDWQGVITCCEVNPVEASNDIFAMTKGGHMAQLTPLHFVMERDPPLEVVESLIEAHLDSTTYKMSPGGQVPLHLACTWGASVDVIGFLLAAMPSAVRSLDEMKNLPLHNAAFSGASEEVVEALICSYPQSVLVRNAQGSLTADIVKRLRHDTRREVLQVLESSREAITARRNSGDLSRLAALASEKNHMDGVDSITGASRRSLTVSPKVMHRHSPVAVRAKSVEVSLDDGVSTTEGEMIWI